MAESKGSKEAHKILAKYKGHLPVVCLSPLSEKRKLLVPCSMKGNEFANVARDKCSWATQNCCLSVEGVPLPLTLEVQKVYEQYGNKDGFLYVTVGSGRSEAAAHASQSQDSVEPALQSKDSSQPKVFHMPDGDQEKFPLSEDARKAQKILKKYPDRVPVLVRQARTPGLPELDKKLLVPRTMTIAGLKGMLPKHLGVPDDVPVDWKRLGLFMGDLPLKEDALMSTIYKLYVDENDGGLHVTLKIQSDKSPATFTANQVDQQPLELQLEEMKHLLEKAQMKHDEELAAAEERIAAAEAAAQEQRAQAAANQDQLSHLSQAYLAETRKCEQLQEAVASKAAQPTVSDEVLQKYEADLDMMKAELAKKDLELDAKTQELACKSQELADKCQAEEEVKQKLHQEMQRALKAEHEEAGALCLAKEESARAASLAERLEKAENEIALLRQGLAEAAARARAHEETQVLDLQEEEEPMQAAADGFIHLGWDQDGFATSVPAEEEFEILVEDEI